MLSKLSKNLTGMTDAGLRRRVSRRLSIIGPKNDFRVYVTGTEITPEDRGYQQVLEYVWAYGDQNPFLAGATKLEKAPFDRTAEVASALEETDLSLNGWIGTVASPGQLKDEEGDNLNRIAIVLVGKPPPEWNGTRAQEDVAAALNAVDARLVFYEQLVDNAQKSYADYLEAHRKVDRLWDVFQSIDDFVPRSQEEEDA